MSFKNDPYPDNLEFPVYPSRESFKVCAACGVAEGTMHKASCPHRKSDNPPIIGVRCNTPNLGPNYTELKHEIEIQKAWIEYLEARASADDKLIKEAEAESARYKKRWLGALDYIDYLSQKVKP